MKEEITKINKALQEVKLLTQNYLQEIKEQNAILSKEIQDLRSQLKICMESK